MLPEEMNRAFRDKQGQVLVLTPLGEAMPARLTIGTVCQFDTLAFSCEVPDLSPLKPGTVEIKALLLRKGIQAINEDELLQIIDITLCNKNSTPYDMIQWHPATC